MQVSEFQDPQDGVDFCLVEEPRLQDAKDGYAHLVEEVPAFINEPDQEVDIYVNRHDGGEETYYPIVQVDLVRSETQVFQ